MFSIRWRPLAEPRPPPDPLEWWERSVRDRDLGEQVARLRRSLELSLACAADAHRPAFLDALGRDLRNELDQLVAGAESGTAEAIEQLAVRSEIIEELVDYYVDSVIPWTRSPAPVELSDCVREAVAGLSADVSLVMRIEAEPTIWAFRRRLISLCELTIRAAATRPEDEVQVTLAIAPPDTAVVEVAWHKAPMPAPELRDSARCLALAVAYVSRLGGTLRRANDARESIVLRIPLDRRTES
jgi:hypothetical protein